MALKRIITLGLVILVFVMLFSACGGGLSGSWEFADGGRVRSTFSFSGNSFTFWEEDQSPGSPGETADEAAQRRDEGRTRTGTYLISRDQSGERIELTWDDNGRIEVYDFSRTENTIEIARTRYTRQR